MFWGGVFLEYLLLKMDASLQEMSFELRIYDRW